MAGVGLEGKLERLVSSNKAFPLAAMKAGEGGRGVGTCTKIFLSLQGREMWVPVTLLQLVSLHGRPPKREKTF